MQSTKSSSLPNSQGVVELKTAHEMWETLTGEYGQSQNSVAPKSLSIHSSSDSMTMQEHIDLFQKLRTDVDYHAPHGVPRLSRGQINLHLFIRLVQHMKNSKKL
jgi:hypothetical protein